MQFVVSNVCSAFEAQTIGTKVTDPGAFLTALSAAVATYNPDWDRTPGQHYVVLNEALGTVSAGVGRKTGNPHMYVLRAHRGVVSAYLQRRYAEPVESLAVIVYTLAAYQADPEVDQAEIDNFPEGTTHVIVAVIASAGPKAPLTPYRFVSNLAGGNRDADTYSIEDVRRIAREIMAYGNDWSVVAD